jgi:hypothetical protein
VDLVHVITSKKFFGLWRDLGYEVQIARFNSTSRVRVLLRKFLLRSILLRKSLKFFITKTKTKNPQIMMPPHNARHFEYVKALRKLPSDDWAILVDSRDLIFQIRPEEIVERLGSETPIHLFLEDGKFFKDGSDQTNDHSPANWNWAAQLVNNSPKDLYSLVGANIVNSGCIAGRVKELVVFFEQSCQLLTNSLHSSYALLDQAAANVLAYSQNTSANIRLHCNGEVVLNMCGVIEEKVEIVDGKLLRAEEVIPIVHQFDRFGTWNPEIGFIFDKREYSVQKFSI